MRILRTGGLIGVLAILLPPGASAQQGPQSLAVHAFGGFGNSPEGFDVQRDVAFNAGVRLGAGLTLEFSDYFSLRADVATMSNSGTDTTLGAIDQSVSFRRSYYSAAVELTLPLQSSVTPYLMVGGGLVRLKRNANEYWYGLTEFSALAGIGVSVAVSPRIAVFAEGTGWLYNRQTVDQSQHDNSLNIGLSYRFTSR